MTALTPAEQARLAAVLSDPRTQYLQAPSGPVTPMGPRSPQSPDDYISWLMHQVTQAGLPAWNAFQEASGGNGQASPEDVDLAFSPGQTGDTSARIGGWLSPLSPLLAAYHMPGASVEAGGSMGAALDDPSGANIAQAGADTGMAGLTAFGFGGLRSVGQAARMTGKTGALGGGALAGAGLGTALYSDLAQAQAQDAKGAALPAASLAGNIFEDAAAKDPKAAALYEQLQALEAKGAQPIKGLKKESADQIRAQAQADAAGVRDQLIARIAEINAAHQPWDQKYPELAKAWTPVALGLAPAVGAYFGVKAGAGQAGHTSALRSATREAEQALHGTPGTWLQKARPGDPELALAALTKLGALRNSMPGAGGEALDTLKAGLTAGLLSAEMKALPYQHDYMVAPVGSDAYEEGKRRSLDIQNTYAGPLAFGALTGASGYHVGKALFPSGRVSKAKADAILKRQKSDDTYIPELSILSAEMQAGQAARGATRLGQKVHADTEAFAQRLRAEGALGDAARVLAATPVRGAATKAKKSKKSKKPAGPVDALPAGRERAAGAPSNPLVSSDLSSKLLAELEVAKFLENQRSIVKRRR